MGVVEQLELWNKGLDPFIVLTIGSLMVAGLMPRSSSFRPGTAEAAVEDVQTIAGRVSFLGLAATLAAEMLTGKVGPPGRRWGGGWGAHLFQRSVLWAVGSQGA